MALRILHTNDMHGTLGRVELEKLRGLREQVDLYFDSGDCVKTGNLGIPLKPEPVWPMLTELNCTASVPGNRESHLLESVVQMKMRVVDHPVLCANWHRKHGPDAFQRSLVLEVDGLKIGVLGVMVPMVTSGMKTQAASQYLWSNPIEDALAVAEELRPTVDLVFALTHIGYSQDKLLAERGGPIDIIFGGHSHTVLSTPVKLGRTWIVQGGSHNRFCGLYSFDKGHLTGELVPVRG